MQSLREAVDRILSTQAASGKPLAVVLAGHNGSGKSTLWSQRPASRFKRPLVNADRMMMSILPEPKDGHLPTWAATLRDEDEGWMRVAQNGVRAFVAQAMAHGVPFAMETVFSHWKELNEGAVESKLSDIKEMQVAGYFVLLIFVGLSSVQLSLARVMTRVQMGGHDVDQGKLVARFSRTQKAIAHALPICEAALLADNSRTLSEAFTVCRVQLGAESIYDIRDQNGAIPMVIANWLEIVAPRRGELTTIGV